MRIAYLSLILVMCFSLASCNLPKETPDPMVDPNLVATMVELTLAGFPSRTPALSTVASPINTSTPSVEASPTPVTSKVTGRVCFPRSGRAEMRAFFQETTKGTVTEMVISADANEYEVILEPGNYIAYVWLSDFSFGGMYSKGSSPDVFAVFPGETTTGVDLCNWNHGPFDVPYPPGYEPQQTTGGVNGQISYPYGSIPAMTLVAFSKSTPYWYWMKTVEGQAYYSITNLPPGKYQVVAYAGSRAGGSNFVTVQAGDIVSADISDWSGSFPENPVK